MAVYRAMDDCQSRQRAMAVRQRAMALCLSANGQWLSPKGFCLSTERLWLSAEGIWRSAKGLLIIDILSEPIRLYNWSRTSNCVVEGATLLCLFNQIDCCQTNSSLIINSLVRQDGSVLLGLVSMRSYCCAMMIAMEHKYILKLNACTRVYEKT